MAKRFQKPSTAYAEAVRRSGDAIKEIQTLIADGVGCIDATWGNVTDAEYTADRLEQIVRFLRVTR